MKKVGKDGVIYGRGIENHDDRVADRGWNAV